MPLLIAPARCFYRSSQKGLVFPPPLAEFSAGRLGSQPLNGNACKQDGNTTARRDFHPIAEQLSEIFDEAD
jgi:hypothetical protein